MSIPEKVSKVIKALREPGARHRRVGHEEILVLAEYIEATEGEVAGARACGDCGVVFASAECPVCSIEIDSDGEVYRRRSQKSLAELYAESDAGKRAQALEDSEIYVGDALDRLAADWGVKRQDGQSDAWLRTRLLRAITLPAEKPDMDGALVEAARRERFEATRDRVVEKVTGYREPAEVSKHDEPCGCDESIALRRALDATTEQARIGLGKEHEESEQLRKEVGRLQLIVDQQLRTIGLVKAERDDLRREMDSWERTARKLQEVVRSNRSPSPSDIAEVATLPVLTGEEQKLARWGEQHETAKRLLSETCKALNVQDQASLPLAAERVAATMYEYQQQVVRLAQWLRDHDMRSDPTVLAVDVAIAKLDSYYVVAKAMGLAP